MVWNRVLFLRNGSVHSVKTEDDNLYQGHKKTPIKYSWCGSESSCFQQGEGASPKDANIDIDAWM